MQLVTACKDRERSESWGQLWRWGQLLSGWIKKSLSYIRSKAQEIAKHAARQMTHNVRSVAMQPDTQGSCGTQGSAISSWHCAAGASVPLQHQWVFFYSSHPSQCPGWLSWLPCPSYTTAQGRAGLQDTGRRSKKGLVGVQEQQEIRVVWKRSQWKDLLFIPLPGSAECCLFRLQCIWVKEFLFLVTKVPDSLTVLAESQMLLLYNHFCLLPLSLIFFVLVCIFLPTVNIGSSFLNQLPCPFHRCFFQIPSSLQLGQVTSKSHVLLYVNSIDKVSHLKIWSHPVLLKKTELLQLLAYIE